MYNVSVMDFTTGRRVRHSDSPVTLTTVDEVIDRVRTWVTPLLRAEARRPVNGRHWNVSVTVPGGSGMSASTLVFQYRRRDGSESHNFRGHSELRKLADFFRNEVDSDPSPAAFEPA